MATTERRPLVVGNWKMNGLRASNAELLKVLDAAITIPRRVEVVLCPPATLIAPFAGLARGSRVKIGAQDCHPEASGAFTGDLSAEMLADAGASFVIVGHSERRLHNAETDGDVRLKALAAWRASLMPIICIGETKADRDAKETLDIIGQQLGGSLPNGARGDNLVVAYEPIWAIGSGTTPTPGDIVEVNTFIRKHLVERYGPAGEGIRILYGGSVKPDNAKELMAAENVDGALVGGASLKADEFLGIIAVYA